MAELPRRGIGRIQVEPRKVYQPVDTLAPVKKLAEGVTDLAMQTFKGAFKAQMDFLEQTEELKFRAKLNEADSAIQSKINQSVTELLAAGKTEEVKTLFAKGGAVDQMIEQTAPKFGDGLYGTRAKTTFENTKANAMVQATTQAIRKNIETGRQDFENQIRKGSGLGGVGQIVQGNAFIDSEVERAVKNGIYSKEEALSLANGEKVRNAKNAVQYFLAQAEVLYNYSDNGLEAARQYLESHDGATSVMPKEVQAEALDALKSKIIQLEARQDARALKAENDAIKSATTAISNARIEAEALMRGGQPDAAMERAKSLTIIAQDTEADPRVREFAQSNLDRLAPVIQKAEYYQAISMDVDSAMQGNYKPLPADAKKTLDAKLTRIYGALPENTPDSQKVAYANIAIANTGLVPEQANLQYERVLEQANNADGADVLVDLWDEANALQNGAVAAKLVKDAKGPGRKIDKFVSEYRIGVAQIPDHIRADPRALRQAKTQIAQASLQSANSAAKPEIIEQREKDFDKVSTRKLFESAYGSQSKNVMEKMVPGFNWTEQQGGAFTNASKVKSEILETTKDLYVNGQTAMDKAVKTATQIAMTKWVWTGKGWASNTPHSLSPTGQYDKKITQDVAGKMVAGGFVVPNQADTLAKNAQFMGNDQDGYFVFVPQGAGLLPVTDDDGNPFIYKPGQN